MPDKPNFDRVEGMMLGLAVGDALGATTEGQLSRQRAAHGEICDHFPARYAGNRPIGLSSDDTQLAFWPLEQMIAGGGLDPGRVAVRFCRDRIFGIGAAVRQFIVNHEAGVPWVR